MGSARVGQIDVVVAGMIPVANVEAKVRHAAVLVAPQQFDPDNSRLFARLRLERLRFGELLGSLGGLGLPGLRAARYARSARRNKAAGLETGGPVIVGLAGRCVAARSVAFAMRCRALR
jgi:hypothetical protein